jgi:hypothetical protein
MLRPRKQSKDARGFINVAVSNETRAGLHLLKNAMGAAGQAEVIEKSVVVGLTIHLATRQAINSASSPKEAAATSRNLHRVQAY